MPTALAICLAPEWNGIHKATVVRTLSVLAKCPQAIPAEAVMILITSGLGLIGLHAAAAYLEAGEARP